MTLVECSRGKQGLGTAEPLSSDHGIFEIPMIAISRQYGAKDRVITHELLLKKGYLRRGADMISIWFLPYLSPITPSPLFCDECASNKKLMIRLFLFERSEISHLSLALLFLLRWSELLLTLLLLRLASLYHQLHVSSPRKKWKVFPSYTVMFLLHVLNLSSTFTPKEPQS